MDIRTHYIRPFFSKYKYTVILILCLTACVLECLLCGYLSKPTFDGWGTSPTGSAKYLDGSTVLVSLFIDDTDSRWNDDRKHLVMSKMDLANEFLVSEGLEYGKDVQLIYNIYEHPDLDYSLSYPDSLDDSDDESILDLLDFVTAYIDAHVSTQDIMATYGVDSIGYMCFLNKNGTSYTFPYYAGDDDIYYYETCFMFVRCDGDFEPPAVYAHEMLHLFGARDLYETNETDGITKDFIQHIEQDYANEIMLTTYDEHWMNVQDSVTNDLTDITAYFIGWLDEIPELETYPSIYYPDSASFGDVGDKSGDYSDYTAMDETFDEHPEETYTDDHTSDSASPIQESIDPVTESPDQPSQEHTIIYYFIRYILSIVDRF